MTRAATPYEIEDHRRDLAKADPRPGDPPSRFDRQPANPINAVEVAAIVKLIPIPQGAELIADFVRAEHQRLRIEERLEAVAAGAQS